MYRLYITNERENTMSEAESKPTKKTKAVKPVAMPEVTIPLAQVPKP